MNSTFVGLTTLLIVATVWDLRHRRIPNEWTAAGVVVALTLGILDGHVGSTVLGLAAGLAVGLPLFALGAVGGGDSKLIAASGAFLGPVPLVSALAYAGVAGGLMALVAAARRGGLGPALRRTGELGLWIVSLGHLGRKRTLETPDATSVPYGAAIAAGALVAWFFPLFTSVQP